jgi:hypothetical protein
LSKKKKRKMLAVVTCTENIIVAHCTPWWDAGVDGGAMSTVQLTNSA